MTRSFSTCVRTHATNSQSACRLCRCYAGTRQPYDICDCMQNPTGVINVSVLEVSRFHSRYSIYSKKWVVRVSRCRWRWRRATSICSYRATSAAAATTAVDVAADADSDLLDAAAVASSRGSRWKLTLVIAFRRPSVIRYLLSAMTSLTRRHELQLLVVTTAAAVAAALSGTTGSNFYLRTCWYLLLLDDARCQLSRVIVVHFIALARMNSIVSGKLKIPDLVSCRPRNSVCGERSLVCIPTMAQLREIFTARC